MTAHTDEQHRRFDRAWSNPTGTFERVQALQHKTIGKRYMVTAFIFFLIGGLLAILMRVQLVESESSLISAETYNELFTMHGTTMMFLFAIPFIEGLATYFLPPMIGARDLAFPRLNAFNYWCYLLGGIILYSSYLFDMVPSSGWFSYVPLTGPEFSDTSMDFWLFGLALAEIAAVGAALEIVISVLRCRAPGMSLNRLPIFAWTMLSAAALIIIAFVPLIVASMLLELDRVVGTAFFDQAAGGSPLLWQHLFWIFGHPEVYVMFLPGAAIISHVIPVHSRHPLVAYPLVVVAIVATTVMSLGLWVHHMYTTGIPGAAMGFFTAASMSIALASGVQIFAWIATLWAGRPRMTTPMLWSLGFMVTFVLGGITGVMIASVTFNTQTHDTYFIVAHFHYVIIGGMLFPLFAALYHWWPKLTGRLYSEGIAKVAFWLIFIGFHVTFFPMHLAGMWGMPRRVFTYDEALGIDGVNLLSTIGSGVLTIGILVLIIGLIKDGRGPRVDQARDPWKADTLEWHADSPPAPENFRQIPVVGSRHPLWDRDTEPDPELAEPVDEAFDTAPVDFRAAPLSTVISAEPDGALILSRQTFWPVIPPIGLGIVAGTVLAEQYWFALVGVATVIVGLLGWAGRNEAEYQHDSVKPLPGGLRFEDPGFRSIGWWGALGAATVIIVGAGTLVFSVLYLQVNASVWPQGATVGQHWGFAIAGVLMLIAVAATWWGSRHGTGGEWDATSLLVRTKHRLALIVTSISGLAAMALVTVMWVSAPLDPKAHAYDSSVWTLYGAASLTLAFAAGITVAAVWARVRHARDMRPALQMQNACLLWAVAALVWGLTWLSANVLPGLGI